jgi:hypothetical protein
VARNSLQLGHLQMPANAVARRYRLTGNALGRTRQLHRLFLFFIGIEYGTQLSMGFKYGESCTAK